MIHPEHWQREVREALSDLDISSVAVPTLLVTHVRQAAAQRLWAAHRRSIAMQAFALAAAVALVLTLWAQAERAQTDALTLTTGIVWIP
jgi:hypothetical protein